jgi:hypothetical protein
MWRRIVLVAVPAFLTVAAIIEELHCSSFSSPASADIDGI